jgi:phage terminase small subunit
MPRKPEAKYLRKRAPKTDRPKSVVIEEQRKVFSDALLEGHNNSDACRAAGYHPSNAANVMRHEDVQMYLEEARSELTDITTLKRLDVLNIFIEAISMARTMSDPAQMINGAKEVGKMMGFYEPEIIKLETASSNVLASKFKALTDAELLEIAAGRAKVVEGEVVE